jgi:quinol monooxygenase YgiN
VLSGNIVVTSHDRVSRSSARPPRWQRELLITLCEGCIDNERIGMSVRLGLFVTLEAKPGKESDLATFLEGGLPVVAAEAGTVTWYAIQQSASTFVIFDTFLDEEGRQAHLSGDLARALGQVADHLLAAPPGGRAATCRTAV